MKTEPARPAGRKKLTGSLEDYLEAILLLVRQGQVARVRDIAKRLGVGMPSVTAALKTLTKRGLVNYDPYQVVTLTDRGRQAAEGVRGRHQVLRRFLTEVLALDEPAAEANACRIEHAVDDRALGRLSEFVEFVQRCRRDGNDWLAPFHPRRAPGRAHPAGTPRTRGAPGRRGGQV